ncbi:hypothetical protein [Goodfellowiella coeruleoviolacea]|uniref:hypothetical protein n=1 Tax=Goodfellowiella coeruleoviolacea TaxID=334858 RepID=UPI0020A24502|nr:hypothetical protein [Goodfellowiella coeruleoviolacea]
MASAKAFSDIPFASRSARIRRPKALEVDGNVALQSICRVEHDTIGPDLGGACAGVSGTVRRVSGRKPAVPVVDEANPLARALSNCPLFVQWADKGQRQGRQKRKQESVELLAGRSCRRVGVA